MDPDHILAAVSGGVDSSIAAHLAQEQGARVEGLTLLLPRTNVDDAAGVCRALGIPHHVGDLGDAFERHVVQPFVDDYAAGRTPNPCVLCNPEVKFRALVEWADRLGCGRIVTGHYARVEMGDDGPRLMRGVDARKDQSYMLYRLDRGVLERLWLPLGERRKRDVRALARELKLPSAEREESQDACFIFEGGAADFVAARRPKQVRPGPIVDADGEVVGEHRGLAHYTVGQRRGLGIGGPDGPYFVLELRVEDNTLVVGPEEALWVERCHVEDVRMLAPAAGARFEAEVMTRMRGMTTPANVELMGDLGLVSFHRPHRAPTPGQAAVFYRDGEVIGGGTIAAPRVAARRWRDLTKQ
ncbi:MAG: tRNA 2-thiouridine(34) synthase MnmA [Armatimonadetes bacterium]|nr:tRNA 2-thiouridine(34) synthase MnmA [Armatimonadota bacterium]